MDEGAFTLCASPDTIGMRLDLFLCQNLPDLSRSAAAHLIREGHVRVSGQQVKPGYHLKAGDRVDGSVPPATPSIHEPEPIALDVMYEDPHLLVLNKPPGLVVHPAPGHFRGTLVNALLHHCPDLKGLGGEIRPGIVHRLDKDTSGLMVVAKDEKTHHALSAQFKSRRVEKEYWALTRGVWKDLSGNICLPIGRHPVDRKKMSVHSPLGRDAETQFQVVEQFPGVALVKAFLKTGRTHQIRVHFAALHHPILGDPVYASGKGQPGLPIGIQGIVKAANRQMLHAKRLGFIHPETKKAMAFESELPKDMALILTQLRDFYPNQAAQAPSSRSLL